MPTILNSTARFNPAQNVCHLENKLATRAEKMRQRTVLVAQISVQHRQSLDAVAS